MTRDEMLAMFTEMIDRCWEAGFDIVTGKQIGRAHV